jgi:protein-tyrosine kinase
MERIQAAIQKAKEQRGALAPSPGAGIGGGVAGSTGGGVGRDRRLPQVGPAWAELAAFEPEPRLLTRNHVVTFEDIDPAHSHFDILRTKVLRTMQKNGWTSVGITSPTSGCGKTTLALNLAFSLAHQPDVRTVLVELDLRRPTMARQIGLKAPQSVAGVLQGSRGVAESFVRYGDNLAIGTNSQSVRDSAELLMHAKTAEGVAAIKRAFLPDIVVYDLPPMLQSDDVMAFLPQLDCVLLVAGAEKSRLDEVDKCEKDLADQTNVLGVVLNSCRYMGEDFGY